jgi:hypothetical protein
MKPENPGPEPEPKPQPALRHHQQRTAAKSNLTMLLVSIRGVGVGFLQ